MDLKEEKPHWENLKTKACEYGPNAVSAVETFREAYHFIKTDMVLLKELEKMECNMGNVLMNWVAELQKAKELNTTVSPEIKNITCEIITGFFNALLKLFPREKEKMENVQKICIDLIQQEKEVLDLKENINNVLTTQKKTIVNGSLFQENMSVAVGMFVLFYNMKCIFYDLEIKLSEMQENRQEFRIQIKEYKEKLDKIEKITDLGERLKKLESLTRRLVLLIKAIERVLESQICQRNSYYSNGLCSVLRIGMSALRFSTLGSMLSKGDKILIGIGTFLNISALTSSLYLGKVYGEQASKTRNVLQEARTVHQRVVALKKKIDIEKED